MYALKKITYNNQFDQIDNGKNVRHRNKFVQRGTNQKVIRMAYNFSRLPASILHRSTNTYVEIPVGTPESYNERL